MDGGEPIMIFGRVTRGDGSPLAEAALTLCDVAGDQLDRTTSDRDGGYQLVPPSTGTYLVICASAARRPQANLIALSDRPLRHDVTLTGGGATLGGRVRAPDGVSAADVVLTLTDLRGTVVAVTRSADDGTYSFADVAEGVHTVTAAAPRLVPVAGTVHVPADGHVDHDVTAAAPVHLAGVVRTATGSRPVPEALATLVAADGTVAGAAVTDVDGAFRFDEVADGTYTLTASGYAPVAAEVSVGAGRRSEVDLVLTAPDLTPPDVRVPDVPVPDVPVPDVPVPDVPVPDVPVPDVPVPDVPVPDVPVPDPSWTDLPVRDATAPDDPTSEFSPAALRRAAAGHTVDGLDGWDHHRADGGR